MIILEAIKHEPIGSLALVIWILWFMVNYRHCLGEMGCP